MAIVVCGTATVKDLGESLIVATKRFTVKTYCQGSGSAIGFKPLLRKEDYFLLSFVFCVSSFS
jgi:hypothetical protein